MLHEIETYNGLLGGPRELGATVMIQIAEPAERDAFLLRARGIERHIVLVVGADEVRATWDESRVLPEQASAVTYVKFALGTERIRGALKVWQRELFVTTDHPEVAVDVALPVATFWRAWQRTSCSERRPRRSLSLRAAPCASTRSTRRRSSSSPASSTTATRRWKPSSASSRAATSCSSIAGESGSPRCTSRPTSSARSASATWRASTSPSHASAGARARSATR